MTDEQKQLVLKDLAIEAQMIEKIIVVFNELLQAANEIQTLNYKESIQKFYTDNIRTWGIRLTTIRTILSTGILPDYVISNVTFRD